MTELGRLTSGSSLSRPPEASDHSLPLAARLAFFLEEGTASGLDSFSVLTIDQPPAVEDADADATVDGAGATVSAGGSGSAGRGAGVQTGSEGEGMGVGSGAGVYGSGWATG